MQCIYAIIHAIQHVHALKHAMQSIHEMQCGIFVRYAPQLSGMNGSHCFCCGLVATDMAA